MPFAHILGQYGTRPPPGPAQRRPTLRFHTRLSAAAFICYTPIMMAQVISASVIGSFARRIIGPASA
jgi:hypothetical protein